MAKKIKLTKKTIKQRDEFLTVTDRALEFLIENSRAALGALIAVILAVILAFGIRFLMQSKQDTATTAMREALGVMLLPLTQDLTDEQILAGVRSFDTEEQRNREAARALEAMIDSYPGTSPANEARYNLAGLYYDIKEYRKALDVYDEYLKRANLKGERAGVLKSLVYFNQAACHYNLGNFKEALEFYRKVIDLKDAPNRAEALVNAARCEEKLDNPEKGLAFMKQAWEEYPEASSVRGILYKIKALEAKVESEPREKPPEPEEILEK